MERRLQPQRRGACLLFRAAGAEGRGRRHPRRSGAGDRGPPQGRQASACRGGGRERLLAEPGHDARAGGHQRLQPAAHRQLRPSRLSRRDHPHRRPAPVSSVLRRLRRRAGARARPPIPRARPADREGSTPRAQAGGGPPARRPEGVGLPARRAGASRQAPHSRHGGGRRRPGAGGSVPDQPCRGDRVDRRRHGAVAPRMADAHGSQGQLCAHRLLAAGSRGGGGGQRAARRPRAGTTSTIRAGSPRWTGGRCRSCAPTFCSARWRWTKAATAWRSATSPSRLPISATRSSACCIGAVRTSAQLLPESR